MSYCRRKLAADAIANNADLLTEILIRLPVKSLIRFKSVSKHWRSLISSPQFSRRFYPDSYLISGLIFHKNSLLINPEHDFVPLTNKPISPPFKFLTFVNHPSGLRILQSCHGLLFCSSFRDRNFKHDYYIYNPTTRLFATLPPPEGRMVHGVNIAYDPAKTAHYKVVCVRGADSWPRDDSNYYQYQIEIYSSETRSWRLSGDPFTAHISTGFKGGVFWNGFIHWINVHDTSLYFNVDEEQLREMPMPPSLIYPDYWEEGRRFVHFGESRKHLHLVEIFGPCTIKFDVYEMKSDYSGWFVKYRVDLSAIPVAFPEMIRSYLDPSDLHHYGFSILGIVRERNDAESYMVLHIPGDKVIHFNLNDRTFNKIWDFDPDREDIRDIYVKGSLRYWWSQTFYYIESLAGV